MARPFGFTNIAMGDGPGVAGRDVAGRATGAGITIGATASAPALGGVSLGATAATALLRAHTEPIACHVHARAPHTHSAPHDFVAIQPYVTLRGVGGQVIYCEEAAHMDLAVFNQVVLPLIEMRNSLLVCISTPLGEDNFYSALMDLRDPEDNEYVFYRVRVIPLCDECQALKKDFCPHLGPVDMPDWKASGDEKKARQVALMYGNDNEVRPLPV